MAVRCQRPDGHAEDQARIGLSEKAKASQELIPFQGLTAVRCQRTVRYQRAVRCQRPDGHAEVSDMYRIVGNAKNKSQELIPFQGR
jgi:hypothetical protein